MGWLIALGVLFALAILPIGISVHYDTDGAIVSLIAGLVRIRLYPAKQIKEKKKAKKEKRSTKTSLKDNKKQKTKSKDKKGKGGSWTDFLPLVRIALDFLDSFRRKLRVNRLDLNLVMAGGDPCDLAINYGKAWAALGNLMPQLERVFVIKKRNLEVQCDFTADKTRINARIDLTIPLGRILYMAIFYGVKLLCQFQKISKTKKGGVK